MIKIDTNGYELQVINALKDTIKNSKPVIILETNQDILNIKLANEATIGDFNSGY